MVLRNCGACSGTCMTLLCAVWCVQVPEMAFGEYWDTCEYTDGVLNYNQV
jgi:hypothetical protein